MPEFSKIFDLPPAKLSRADVEALGRLMVEGLPPKRNSFKFQFRVRDATYHSYSLDELLAQELPVSIDRLEFTVHGWNDDNGIDRSVTINLGRITASCSVRSLDETWYKGKTQQLLEFFTMRSPWYGTIRPYLPGILGGLQGILISASVYFFLAHQFLFVLVAGITFAILAKSVSGFLHGDLFPLTDIRLSPMPDRIDKEAAMVIFTAVSAIGTVAGVIVQLFQKVC
jgi:hypothetical protein